jgi:transcription elongation factor Elf1|nr:MAG TPA: cysteine-rich protein [Caudoviricetes sp.]
MNLENQFIASSKAHVSQSSKTSELQMEQWLFCPVCNNKTRIKLRVDTVLKNFPLYCPKCKQELLINVQRLNISVIKEPDAKTQSR